MSGKRLVILAAVALLALSAGCDSSMETWNGPGSDDPAVGESCLAQGYDAGTEEYDDCVGNLSAE